MAVSKKGNRVVEPSPEPEAIIKNTIQNWKSIKKRKQSEKNNVPLQTDQLITELRDFSSKRTFKDIKVRRKNSSDLSKNAFQRVKTSEEAEVETTQILEQNGISRTQEQREIARPKTDQIKDTTGFNNNKEDDEREVARLGEIQKQREIARCMIDQIKQTAGFNDNMQGEREYRMIVRLGEIQKRREVARREIDQIENTAGFNDNMEAEQEFHKLIGGRFLFIC